MGEAHIYLRVIVNDLIYGVVLCTVIGDSMYGVLRVDTSIKVFIFLLSLQTLYA